MSQNYDETLKEHEEYFKTLTAKYQFKNPEIAKEASKTIDLIKKERKEVNERDARLQKLFTRLGIENSGDNQKNR